MASKQTAVNVALSKGSNPLILDAGKLSGTRALIQASSGGGKSYLLRLIVESVADKMPVIIIDPEGEFFTAREVCSMVLVGPGGELQADPKTAGKVARGLLDQSCSAIIDLSDLPSKQHAEYVEAFLTAMMHAPKRCWRPTLVCIDEAHRFCPEGHKGTGAAGAVIDLMSRGRKRGYGGVLLTQRISKVAKDAVAEAANQFFGCTTLDVDIKRSADMLGMTNREAQILRSMDPGEWYAHGPAIKCTGVERFQAMLPQTEPPDPAGQTVPPVKGSRIVNKIAAQMKESLAENGAPLNLEDANQLIKKQNQSIRNLEKRLEKSDHSQEVALLRSQLADALKGPSLSEIKQIIRDEKLQMLPEIITAHEKMRDVIEAAKGSIATGVELASDLIYGKNHTAESMARIDPMAANNQTKPPVSARAVVTHHNDYKPTFKDETMGRAEKKMLESIAWYAGMGIAKPTIPQVAAMAGYAPKSGHVSNTLGKLVKMGYIERSGGAVSLLDSARAVVTIPAGINGDLDDLHASLMALDCIGGTGAKMLQYIIENTASAGDELTIDDIANGVGLTPGSGHVSNTIGKLVKICVIERSRGKIATTNTLYPK